MAMRAKIPPADTQRYLKVAVQLVQEAGAKLLKHFGKIRHIRQKEHPSSVVCAADIASERLIIAYLRAHFPEDSILAEESGWVRGSSQITWVIDPLDGTSNFVAGIPWFGAQVGVVQESAPIAAAMYLPVEGTLYSGTAGGGAYRNGVRLGVTPERTLQRTLCAFGFDASASLAERRKHAELLMRVAGGVRNTRATNSLVDFCYTMEGRFGGCINLNCKIWDIVPVSLLLPEAGGRFTDFDGEPIVFVLDDSSPQRSYQVLGAPRALHAKLVELTSTR